MISPGNNGWHFPPVQSVLSVLAMLILGVLALLMVWFTIPQPNHDFLVFILGALSGALTVGGGKVADRIMNSTGPDATISTEPTKEKP